MKLVSEESREWMDVDWMRTPLLQSTSSPSAAGSLVLSLTGAVSSLISDASEYGEAELLSSDSHHDYLLDTFNLSNVLPSAEALNSTSDQVLSPAHLNERLNQVLVLTGIFVAIIVGNVPVVITILFGRLGRTRMYYFLLHLCFADLLTGLFSVVPQLAWELTRHFHGGNILCKTVKYLQLLGPYLSSFTLSAMSIDRFLAICHPLTNNHLSLNRAKQSIAVAWFLSLLFCVPQALIFSYVVISRESGVMECWATFPFQPWGERLYVTWYAFSVFIVPFCIIFYTHFRICGELWKNSQHRRSTLRSDRTKSQPGPTVSLPNPSESKIQKSQESAESSSDKNNHHSHFLEIQDEETLQQSGKQAHPSVLKPTSAGRRNISKTVEFAHVQNIAGSELLESNETAGADALAVKIKIRTSLTISRIQDDEHLRAKIKSVKLTVIVILCYVSCSLPFIMVQLWAYWYPGAQESSYWTGLSILSLQFPLLPLC